MIPRFFVPDADTSGSIVDLPDEEAAHLIRVLRLSAGAPVRVFDGRGREWAATVDRATRSGASVHLDEPAVTAPEPGVSITLAVAVLKSDKTDDVIRDAVMLGVTAVCPLLTERTEVSATVLAGGHRIERWQRIAISSAKQCGRAVVPAIQPVSTLERALEAVASQPRLALVEPRDTGLGVYKLNDVPRSARVELFVGPEGGWTGREVQRLAAAGMLMTLGRQTLRADAVPLVALTALRVAWDDF